MVDKYHDDPFILALCARLRAAREAADVNLATAARAMGMTPTRLSAVELARIEPRAKDIGLVARLTGVSVAHLLLGDDPAEWEPIAVPDTPEARRVSPGSAGRARSLQRRRETKSRSLPKSRAQPVPAPAGPTWTPAAWRSNTRPEPAAGQVVARVDTVGASTDEEVAS